MSNELMEETCLKLHKKIRSWKAKHKEQQLVSRVLGREGKPLKDKTMASFLLARQNKAL